MIKEMSSPEGVTKYAWERLSFVTLVRIILFNRRRQGEASKMKLTDYTQGLDSDKHNEDVLKELSPFEKELCKVLSRIEITGKRGRIVPVILTNTMKEALDHRKRTQMKPIKEIKCQTHAATQSKPMPDKELDDDMSDSESVKNPFTDSSSSEWSPNPSDEEDIHSSDEETYKTNESAWICKSTTYTANPEPSMPCHSEYHQNETDVSDSGSSIASVQYPMLSVPSNDAPQIGIQPKSSNWSKYHACYFCEKQVIKMARHLEMKHKNEVDVAQILSLPKKSSERRKCWLKMINEGDYNHNFNVLGKGQGTVIPKYRGKNKEIGGFVPCPTCKGLYRKNKVSSHSLSCCPGKRGKAYREGSLMLPIPKHVSKSLWQNVILKMKDDPISRKTSNDPLIIAFGERMYNKRDVEEHTAGQISGRMRELARLILDLVNESKGKISSLTDALQVKNFDSLITSVRNVAGCSDETHSFQKGSLALKLGYSVKKSATILKTDAIKNGDKMQIDNAESFLSLFSGNWCDHISSTANQSLERKKFNKPQLLPCCQDVQILYSYVKNITAGDYPTMARAALCEISIFNRKRGDEVQRMTLDIFENGKKNQGSIDDEIVQALTPIERKLVKTLTRIEIRGKFNRRVAILLTQSMLTKIDIIIKERERLSINSKYLFATPNGERPYRGSDVIRLMANEAGVSSPHIFTWTSLRKQVATISQALEISETEQDQLAQFLGHDIRVHRDFYRLPHDILQKAKVAKILMKINAGKATSIEDYSLEENFELELDNSSAGESDLHEEDEECQRKTKNSVTKKVIEPFAVEDCGDSVRCREEIAGTCTRKNGKKRKWTTEERHAVLKHLSIFIQMKKVPAKTYIEKVIKKEECLK